MAARFDWAVPTILGNADEPVLSTDVATKNYVDTKPVPSPTSIANGNTSVVANPSNVMISAGRANNFTFLHEPEGSILYFETDVSVNSFIQTLPGASGLNFCDGMTVSLDAVEPYSGNETLGSDGLRWDNIYGDGLDILGTAIIGTGNIATINANVITANIVNSSGGNITANRANANVVTANTVTANTVSFSKMYQTNVYGRLVSVEKTVAANTQIVLPWATDGINIIPDIGFIQVGSEPLGGIRNNGTDTLVLSVTGSILWNTNTNTGNSRLAYIYVGDQLRYIEQNSIPSGDSICAQTLSAIIVLPPSQYFSVQVKNSSGGSANTGGPIVGFFAAPTNVLDIVVVTRKTS